MYMKELTGVADSFILQTSSLLHFKFCYMKFSFILEIHPYLKAFVQYDFIIIRDVYGTEK